MPKTNSSSVLMTHWDPDIYVPQVATPWLQELIMYSLLFGQVVVRDVDLFQNESIGRRLVKSKMDFDILVELVRTRCIKILTLHPETYKGIRADPYIEPFTARSERHSSTRSFKGKKWQPKQWQKELCLRLDAALIKSEFRFQANFPKRNDFAPTLAKTLTDYPSKNVPWFKKIGDDARERFVELCSGESLWESFLLVEHREKNIVGKGQGFYRTAAYQCARQFPKSERALRNIIQSTYAWCECSRENIEGRFGGRLLWEIPHSYGSPEQDDAATDALLNTQIVPRRTEGGFAIPILPGIGEILAATREHKAFGALQDIWAGVGRPEMTEREFWIAYDNLVWAFAEKVSKKQVPLGNHPTWHLIGAGLAYGGKIAGVSLGLSEVVASAGADLAGLSIGLLGPRLSRFVRSVPFQLKATRKLKRAVEIRTNKGR